MEPERGSLRPLPSQNDSEGGARRSGALDAHRAALLVGERDACRTGEDSRVFGGDDNERRLLLRRQGDGDGGDCGSEEAQRLDS